MTTGEKIYQLRKKVGISQEELAQQVGVSRQAISKWERDEAIPDADKIILLSSIFSISTDYLLIENIETLNDSIGPTLPQSKSARAKKKRRLGWVLLGIGIPLTIFYALMLYVWQAIMKSPEIEPIPDAFAPIAMVFDVTTIAFPLLSLFLIGFGAYHLVVYRKGHERKTRK